MFGCLIAAKMLFKHTFENIYFYNFAMGFFGSSNDKNNVKGQGQLDNLFT